MSLAHQEESTVEFRPLDMLERSVEDHGWPFERSGRDELNLSVAGRWCDHHFCFTWREDLQSLHLSSAFEMRVESARRTEMAALLMHINAKLWIGHFDLTNSLGIPAQFGHPAYLEAVDRVLAACRAHGKAAGFMVATAEEARAKLDQGFRCLAFWGDIWIYQQALSAGLSSIRSAAARSV